jgi:hypothetical protein
MSGGTPFDKLTATPPRTKIRRPWSAVRRHFHRSGNLRDETLITLMLHTGLRVSEILQFKVGTGGAAETKRLSAYLGQAQQIPRGALECNGS